MPADLGFSFPRAWGRMEENEEGKMHDILLWISAPLFLLGLCLSLFFHCFTKRNLLAWLAALLLNPVIAVGIAQMFTLGDYVIYLFRGFIVFALMLAYFYGIRKNTPFREAFSFSLFAATAFPIVELIGFWILLCIGVVRC